MSHGDLNFFFRWFYFNIVLLALQKGFARRSVQIRGEICDAVKFRCSIPDSLIHYDQSKYRYNVRSANTNAINFKPQSYKSSYKIIFKADGGGGQRKMRKRRFVYSYIKISYKLYKKKNKEGKNPTAEKRRKKMRRKIVRGNFLYIGLAQLSGERIWYGIGRYVCVRKNCFAAKGNVQQSGIAHCRTIQFFGHIRKMAGQRGLERREKSKGGKNPAKMRTETKIQYIRERAEEKKREKPRKREKQDSERKKKV